MGVLKCRTCAAKDRERCAGCKKRFGESVRKIERCGFLWHPSCIACQFCKRNLGKPDDVVYNVRGKPCCETHYKALGTAGKLDKRGRLTPGAVKGVDEHLMIAGAGKKKRSATIGPRTSSTTQLRRKPSRVAVPLPEDE
jgi:hypothetical protein